MADQRSETDRSTSEPGIDAVAHGPQRAWRRLRAERGEVASWLILMAGLVAAAVLAAAALGLVVDQLANDVASAAEGAPASPGGALPEPGNPDPNGGDTDPTEGGTEPPDPDSAAAGEPLPVRTSHCSVTVKASGAALGMAAGGAVTGEVIIQEMPDGSKIVTIAGELAGNAGTSAPIGAGVTLNDTTVGAYARASAAAWGAVGGGVRYELAPGESVGELFVGLGLASNPVTGIVTGGINSIAPGTLPQPPPPHTIFVDGSVWGTAGGTAQAGIGWISAGADATGTIRLDKTYAMHRNRTYSATTTYSGDLKGDAGVTGGIPFFAWGQTELAGQAEGSISVQTIYDSGFNPIEMIVTTSYGADGDTPGSEADGPTITTQQWSLNLRDPDVREAVNNLEAFAPSSPIPGLPLIPTIPTQNPAEAWEVLATNANTSGPVSQELSTDSLNLQVEAGAIVAGVRGGVTGTCTELN